MNILCIGNTYVTYDKSINQLSSIFICISYFVHLTLRDILYIKGQRKRERNRKREKERKKNDVYCE